MLAVTPRGEVLGEAGFLLYTLPDKPAFLFLSMLDRKTKLARTECKRNSENAGRLHPETRTAAHRERGGGREGSGRAEKHRGGLAAIVTLFKEHRAANRGNEEAEAGTGVAGGRPEMGDLRDASSVEPTRLAHGRWACAKTELRARRSLSRFRLCLTQHPPIPANARAPGPSPVPPSSLPS